MRGYKRNGLHTHTGFRFSNIFCFQRAVFFSNFLLSKQNQVPHIFVNRFRVIYHIKALVVVIRTLLSFLTKNFRTISSVENNGLTIVKYAYSTLIIELTLFLVFLSDHFIAEQTKNLTIRKSNYVFSGSQLRANWSEQPAVLLCMIIFGSHSHNPLNTSQK